MVNMTCPAHPERPEDPVPFYHDGKLNFKAHDVGWIICGSFTIVATVSSIWLIWKHLTYYTLPTQQRHIVRLLIMVPIYAIVSFMSFLFYKHALYYQTIRDCYEAVLITSFFYLLLAYTGDTRAEQHAVFRNLKFNKWVWPLGSWKWKPQGMHFLWVMKISILQYAIVRPVCTLAAVGMEYFGIYCLASWMPWFGHVWCALFISISVSWAMYCLIQFYFPIKSLVDPYKPILKFLAIKTIVFITFWQDTFLSFLVSFGVIKDTEYFSAEHIQVGINAILQCFWMLLFGFIHIKAFSYIPYRPADRTRTTLRGRAFLDVLDFRDWFWEMKDSSRYMRKGKDFTLADDIRAKRHEHLTKALGKERKAVYDQEIAEEREELPTFWKHPLPTEDLADQSEKDSDVRKSVRPTDEKDRRRQSKGRRGLSADLEKLAAEVDQEDETDGLLPDHHETGSRRNSDATVQSLDYVARIGHSHPELSLYHAPPAPPSLVNVPSMEFSSDSGKGTRRKKDLSAVEEEEDVDLIPSHDTPAQAGVGAFGVARWLGWNGYSAAPPTEHAQQGEKGWWRSFHERLSGSGEHEDEETAALDKFSPLPHRIGTVSGGSWGDLQARYEADSASLSPDAESPLSRIIITHRDSLTPADQKAVATALTQASALAPAPVQEEVVRPQPSSSRPVMPPRIPSHQASVEQAQPLSRRMTTSTATAPTVSSRAAQTFVSAAETTTSSLEPTADGEPIKIPPLTKKSLPQVAGPKGRPIKIVIPSPLSPSRYPYGQEGDAQVATDSASAPVLAPAPAPAPVPAPVQPVKEERKSTLRFSHPPKPSPRAETSPAPEDKGKRRVSTGGMITIGGMSLAQTRAKEAEDQKRLAAELAEAREEEAARHRMAEEESAKRRRDEEEAAKRRKAEEEAAKRTGKTSSSSKPAGKIKLGAPSQLATASGGADDPFAAGLSVIKKSSPPRANAAPAGEGAGGSAWHSTTSRTTTSMHTAFEVGSILPRQAVYPAQVPPPQPQPRYYPHAYQPQPPPQQQQHQYQRGYPYPYPQQAPPQPYPHPHPQQHSYPQSQTQHRPQTRGHPPPSQGRQTGFQFEYLD